MTGFSGKCLCGSVTYTSSRDPILVANCHCDDCRKSSGAPYSVNVLVPEDRLTINGNLKDFTHVADSGNQMTKRFCGTCGAQVFSRGSGRPGIVSLKAGTIDELDVIVPTRTVYRSSKIPSTPLDEGLEIFEKMPT